MHDLNTISKLNADAFADSIRNYQSQGRFVVAKYSGLHLLSIETFSNKDDAEAAVHAQVEASETLRIFYPTGTAPARDQSEDRVAA